MGMPVLQNICLPKIENSKSRKIAERKGNPPTTYQFEHSFGRCGTSILWNLNWNEQTASDCAAPGFVTFALRDPSGPI